MSTKQIAVIALGTTTVLGIAATSAICAIAVATYERSLKITDNEDWFDNEHIKYSTRNIDLAKTALKAVAGSSIIIGTSYVAVKTYNFASGYIRSLC